MKKLLFTAIAAAGAAFGLQAAVTLPSGTSFEGVDASAAPVALNGASGVNYLGAGGSFSFPTGDYKADITAYATGEAPRHIDAFSAVDGNYNFLDVKTSFGDPLNYGLEAADIGDGLYFDSLVKFTACDEAPTTDYQDAKIVVWYQETDAEGSTPGVTNFFIKAGQYANGQWTSATYECTYPDEIDMTAWHRLTIKAIENVTTETTQAKYVTGFVVFVDGQAIALPTGSTADTGLGAFTLNASAAEFASRKQLFPSLVQGTQAALKISSVGFDGQGAIDDIVLTDDAPVFAKDKEFFTITMGEHVTGFTYKVDSEDPVEKKADVQLPYTSGMTVTISDVTCDDGYMYKELTGDTASGNVFTPTAKDQTGTITAQAVGVTIGNQKFANLADAFAYINETATGDVVMELKSGLASGELAQPITIAAKAGLTSVKIDLAGKTISCAVNGYVITSAVPLWITDSATDGKIANTITPGEDVWVGAVTVAAEEGSPTLTIDAGTFDGMVVADNGSIIGGSFKDVNNVGDEECYLDGLIPTGYKWDYDSNNGYYVVSAKTGWAFYLAEGEKENEFLIQNERNLLDLATNCNKSADFATAGVTFKQTADIPVSGTPWTPIGAANNKDNLGTAATYQAGAFQGTFDGQNHTITGIVLPRADYAGFFGSTYGATIKNVTLAVKDNTTGFATEGGTSDFCGGLVVGVSVKTTIENVTTATGTFKAQKVAAGIVGYAAGGTVLSNCVNNLNVISIGNEKVAGLIGCAQNSGNWTPAYVTIDGCTNNGNVECQASGKIRAALLVSYTDFEVKFQGNITANGTVTQAASTENIQSIINLNGGSATVVDGAVIKAPANMKSTIHNGKVHAGLNYATVKDDVATFVADSAAVAGANLKVMTTGNTITLANLDDSITLDTTLATATVSTTAENAYVKKEGNVYTVTAKQSVDFTITIDPTDAEWTDTLTLPTPKITGTTATGTWSPATITEPEAGTTNTYTYTVTVAETETTLETTKTATFKVYKKAAGPVYPQDLPKDPTVQAKYAAWAAGKTIEDPDAPVVMEAFLLNCELSDVATEKAKFKIVSITQDANGVWIVKVTGEKGEGAEYGNGFVEIVPYEGIDVGDNGELFQAKLVPQLSTKDE